VVFLCIILFAAILLVGLCICVIASCARTNKKKREREAIRRAKTQAKIAELKAKEEKANKTAVVSVPNGQRKTEPGQPVVVIVKQSENAKEEQRQRDERLRREQDVARSSIRERRGIDRQRIDAVLDQMGDAPAVPAPASTDRSSSSSSSSKKESSSSFEKSEEPAKPAKVDSPSPVRNEDEALRDLRKNLSTHDFDRIITQMNDEFGPDDKPKVPGRSTDSKKLERAVSDGWKETDDQDPVVNASTAGTKPEVKKDDASGSRSGKSGSGSGSASSGSGEESDESLKELVSQMSKA